MKRETWGVCRINRMAAGLNGATLRRAPACLGVRTRGGLACVCDSSAAESSSQPRLAGWDIERDTDSETPTGDAEAQEAVAAADTAIAKQQMQHRNSDEEKGANKRRGCVLESFFACRRGSNCMMRDGS